MSILLFLQIALTVIALSGVLLIISMVRLTLSINRINKKVEHNLNSKERVANNGTKQNY